MPALPFRSDFAHYFNEIAWEVMQELDIPVMDTYWMTYSRLDHRNQPIPIHWLVRWSTLGLKYTCESFVSITFLSLAMTSKMRKS
jgi:hypothetical protein